MGEAAGYYRHARLREEGRGSAGLERDLAGALREAGQAGRRGGAGGAVGAGAGAERVDQQEEPLRIGSPTYATLCYATLRYATLRYATLCYAMLCYAMLCYAMLCYAMLCYAIGYAMLCCAILCYAMLCYAVLCDVMRGQLQHGGGGTQRARRARHARYAATTAAMLYYDMRAVQDHSAPRPAPPLDRIESAARGGGLFCVQVVRVPCVLVPLEAAPAARGGAGRAR